MGSVSEHTMILFLPWNWTLLSLPFLLVLGYCVYNIVFHPLAKYPGPFWAKVTILRGTYHAWKGDVHLDTWRCHQIYGPIVRYAPDKLVFSSPNAMKDIYSVSSNVTKDPMYSVLGKDKLNLVSLVDKKEHFKRRKLVASSFSPANVKDFEPRMLIYVQRFLDALLPRTIIAISSWGPAINMSDWCSYLTFDAMTDFLFGLKYDILRDATYRHVVHDIEATNVRLYVLTHSKFLYLGRLDKWLFPAAARGSRGFLNFINQVFSDLPYSDESSHLNPFTRFAQAKAKDGQPLMTAKQIHSEGAMFITAAQDTTSITLRAIIFYLSRNPHTYARLAHEIRTTFATDEVIGADEKLEGCAYLHACIREAMRMSPAVPGTAMFRHVSPGGQTIDGEHIPAGYNVAAGIYTVHHNEEIFPRPFEFIPERWIADEHTTQEQLDLRTKMWVPFSMGPRACIGKAFAQTLISMTVAALMNTYDFRVADGPEGTAGSGHPFGEMGRTNPGEFQLYDRIVATGVGPVLQLKRRSPAV
ncbi:cytochrome P450 [Aspergillus recurvatus]